ncbi:MAG: NAD-dependent epimerase/dehydratase family protein, partial [Promethearchaeota archaeon]
TSSVAVFGNTSNLTPPIPADHPVNPNDIYSNHKVECEELIKKSKLKEWIILRIGLASYIEVEMATDQIEAMFDYPADLRVEFVHVKDVALACKNALTTEHINESYIIGGGSSCQMTYYDVLTQIFSTFHLPPPPREKFSTEVPYGNDWYDTTRSQKVFQYQRHTFDDYLKDVQDALGRKRIFLRLMSPITSLYMKRLYNKP